MNVSIEYLLTAVIDSLEREVLPHLEAQAAPASNVRACLMLLTNIGARVADESRGLFEDNRELRALLQDAANNASQLGLSPAIGSSVLAALQEHPPQDVWFDASEATRANRVYQELLTTIVNGLSGKHQGDDGFRGKLHSYLQRLSQKDLQLVEKALARTPV